MRHPERKGPVLHRLRRTLHAKSFQYRGRRSTRPHPNRTEQRRVVHTCTALHCTALRLMVPHLSRPAEEQTSQGSLDVHGVVSGDGRGDRRRHLVVDIRRSRHLEELLLFRRREGHRRTPRAFALHRDSHNLRIVLRRRRYRGHCRCSRSRCGIAREYGLEASCGCGHYPPRTCVSLQRDASPVVWLQDKTRQDRRRRRSCPPVHDTTQSLPRCWAPLTLVQGNSAWGWFVHPAHECLPISHRSPHTRMTHKKVQKVQNPRCTNAVAHRFVFITKCAPLGKSIHKPRGQHTTTSRAPKRPAALEECGRNSSTILRSNTFHPPAFTYNSPTCMKGVRMATPPTCFFAAAELYNDAIPMMETRVPGDTLSTRFRSRTTMMLRGISPVGTTSGLSCNSGNEPAPAAREGLPREKCNLRFDNTYRAWRDFRT